MDDLHKARHWLCTKELARALTQPTTADKQKQHYKQYIRPTDKKINSRSSTRYPSLVDTDGAGCATTRKSTTGFLIKAFDATIHYGSRTQATIAHFLKEALNMKKINIRIHTDSSSGKSMATRIGASKKAKRIELKHLFIQQLVAHDLVRIVKINTTNNPALQTSSPSTLQQRRFCVISVMLASAPSITE